MTIWALHGFLGLPSDFDSLKKLCLQKWPDLKWNSVDYLHVRELSPHQSLKEWGHRFNQYVQKKLTAQDSHILLGYSQGGRLALHALQENPELWVSAILISANPGISEGEKPARLLSDQQWAQKFLNDNFARTVEQWNKQTVFQGSKAEPVRLENQFNRRQLAECLDQWSVARQQNFMPFLAQTQSSLLYVAGEKDPKYCQIGSSLNRLNRRIGFEMIPDCGHRVLFDQPEKLAEKIAEFLTKKNS